MHEFRYINRVKDLPNTRKLVSRALQEMKTSTDLKNIPRLIEGICIRAQRNLPDAYFTKIVRILSMNGHSNTILEMIRAPKRTGFQLTTHETIAELLTWLQHPAIESGWNEEATLEAYKDISKVLELLETEPLHTNKAAHHPSNTLAFPFYRDPQFLAARLHVTAAQAIHHPPKKEWEQKAKIDEVKKYAQQLLKLWPKNTGLLDLHPPEAHADKHALNYQMTRATFAWHATPVLSALRMAQEVVEPEVARELEKRAAQVEKELAQARAEIVEGRWLPLYEKLIGEPFAT